MNRREFIRRGTLAISSLGCANASFAFLPENYYESENENKESLPFRKDKIAREIKENIEGFLWLDAADFSDYGGWVLDTQFAAFMGSSYLLAPYAGGAAADAQTKIKISNGGKYRLWVRSKNWVPEYAPGIFKIRVGEEFSKTIFGAQKNSGWSWQDGGVFDLKSGDVNLSLCDQTGYFSRCSSIILTRNLDYLPPASLEAFRRERAHLCAMDFDAMKNYEADVVVVGAGPAGCAAAIASARTGAKTLLVGDRPIVGGNASDEIGVLTEGAARYHKDKFMRESGIIEEAVRLGRANDWLPNMTRAFKALIDAEKNLTFVSDLRIVGVEKTGTKIYALKGMNTLSGENSLIRGKTFIDCTGDGWVGHYADAEFRMGREASSEFEESMAPQKADNITMSGTLRGSKEFFKRGFTYKTAQHESPKEFVRPDWVYTFSDEWKRRRGAWKQLTESMTRGSWWLENRGEIDDMFDAEAARDELVRINISFWNYLKNEWKNKTLIANYELVYLPFMMGKRESGRIMGDYILTENDLRKPAHFDDVIGHTGWSIDIHSPLGIFDPKSAFDGDMAHQVLKEIAEIPYRCLYSKNIDNLFMAGRNASVSHIALGSVRVQAQCAVMGQAAGTAAAMALKMSLSPREFGKLKISDLQQRLLKDDQYLPNIKNEDTSDLARKAEVSASSSESAELAAQNVINGVARQVGNNANMWESARSQSLPQHVELDFDNVREISSVHCVFNTNLKPPSHASNQFPEECVSDYKLEAFVSGSWKTVSEVVGNFQRFRKNDFEKVSAKKIRLTVLKTHGAKTAQIFEIRAYA